MKSAVPWRTVVLRAVLCSAALLALAACERESEAQLLASAKALLDKRDVNGAVIQLKNALEKNPDSAPARLLLGSALLRSGDAAAAQIELRKAQAAGASDEQVLPELARALLASGQGTAVIGQFAERTLSEPAAHADLQSTLAAAYAGQGNLDAARQAAVVALQAQPGHGAATVLLARLEVAGGDADGALRRLDALLARDAGHEAAGLLKGELLLRARNAPDQALQAFRQVRSAQPGSVAAQVAVVNTLLQLNKADEARSEFASLEKSAPRHPETLFLQARFAFDAKDWAGSREIAEKLLAASPQNLRVLMLAAAAEYQLKRYTLAEALLARALKAAPQLLTARHLLAQTYLRSALPDKAIEALQPVLDSATVDATTLSLAGQAYLLSGDSQRSEAAFQKALKLSPADKGLRTSLAVAQLARGDNSAAVTQLESIASGDAGTQADLALISARLQRRDFAGALTAIDALARKAPDLADPPTLRGRVLAQQGRQAEATASFEQALAKDPKHFGAIAGLAELDFGAGKPELARKRFEKLLEADPRHQPARLALARLEMRMGAPEAVVAAQLRDAVRIDPSQPVAQLMLVDRLLTAGDVQGALVAAQDASAALPQDLAIMDALGRAQIAAGDGQRAVSTFKKLAALQPRRAQHLARLADAHMAAQDRTAAAVALRQALEVEPGYLPAQRGLALLAVMDRRPQDGVAIARTLQKRQPQDAFGFALEGEVEGMARNWAAAATAYQAALQRHKSTELAMRLHHALAAAGKAAEAERMAADWQKGQPRDSSFVYYLGDRAATAKDWARAESLYRAVLAAQPRHAAAMNNVAWLMATQRKPGAVAMAEQANALLPERAPLLDTLALALEAENQLPKAVEVQKRAAELDPKNPQLRLRLAQLQIKKGDKADARNELEALARLGTRFPAHAEVSAMLKAL